MGPYVLGTRIAQGGMGEIYTAARLGIGNFRKPIALKLLLSHLADEEHIVDMFLGEALIAARMNHPNIVQVYDVGQDAGRYYMAMELVHGVAMWSFIGAMARRGQRLPASLICYIGRQLCDGLHYAHELRDDKGQPLNVIHRDVTPANILLTSEGYAKLTDFGIAKARDVMTKTYPGTVKGTLEYLSPEQASGGLVDRRADIYCAGVTLFHLATYQSPFWKGNDLGTIHAIQNEPLPSLTRLRPDLPSALATALSNATHKDPTSRFATAREFRDALPVPNSAEECARDLAHLVRELMGADKPVPVPVQVSVSAPSAAPLAHVQEERTLQLDVTQLRNNQLAAEALGNADTVKRPAQVSSEAKGHNLKPSRRKWTTPAIALAAVALVGAAVFGTVLRRQVEAEGPSKVALSTVGEPVVKRESVAPARAKPRGRAGRDDVPEKDSAKGKEVASKDLSPTQEPPAIESSGKDLQAESAKEAARESTKEAGKDSAKEVAKDSSKEAGKDSARETGKRSGSESKSAARMGYLNVRSSRTAQVYVAGKRIGETPVTRYPVSPGEVTVIVKAGPGKSQRHVLKVAAGKQSDLRAEFR